MTPYVLDTSALLTYIENEEGAIEAGMRVRVVAAVSIVRIWTRGEKAVSTVSLGGR